MPCRRQISTVVSLPYTTVPWWAFASGATSIAWSKWVCPTKIADTSPKVWRTSGTSGRAGRRNSAAGPGLLAYGSTQIRSPSYSRTKPAQPVQVIRPPTGSGASQPGSGSWLVNTSGDAGAPSEPVKANIDMQVRHIPVIMADGRADSRESDIVGMAARKVA